MADDNLIRFRPWLPFMNDGMLHHCFIAVEKDGSVHKYIDGEEVADDTQFGSL